MTNETKEFFGIFAALCKKYNVKVISAMGNTPIIQFAGEDKGTFISFDYDAAWQEVTANYEGAGMRIKETKVTTEFVKV